MPFINVKTNVSLDEKKKQLIENRLSDAIGLIPGKSDRFLMCAVEDNVSMMFHRDTDSPLAFVEVKLLGSSTREAYTDLTAAVCDILRDEAAVDGNNCYVRFEEVEHWGMNGFLF